MKTRISIVSILFALLLTIPLAAQTEPPASVETLKPFYLRVQGFIAKVAEQVPEETYSFQPTPEVNTLGQMLAHVASGQYMMCSMALGEEDPNTANLVETATTKEAILEALAGSNEVCNRAYEMSDVDAGKTIRMFGNEVPALASLILNYGHVYEHYGNLVTYMRINGMVPPSSQRG